MIFAASTGLNADQRLAKARALRAVQEERQLQQIAEFETFRPTPRQGENDLLAGGELPMVKQWDLSPIDLSSFDPTEPPGRPGPAPLPDPPVCTTPASIVSLGGIEVGDVLAGQQGSWTGSPTIARQWTAAGEDILGETAPGYTRVEADLGLMIGLRITGTNSAGSATAEAEPVGPIVPAP
jgi:hypothetical protein